MVTSDPVSAISLTAAATTWMDGMRCWKKALRQKLPFFEKLPFFDAPDDGPCEDAYAHMRLREQLAAA
jgi:hypothetical protein